MELCSRQVSPILVFVLMLWEQTFSSPCRLSEYTCDNGNCIGLGRYCDSSDDCGDGSDETDECTPCNRTLYGEINIKYPLRITEPYQRHMPFFCRIRFIAGGRDYGDIVELTFLSFQVGSFEIHRNHTTTCKRGFVRITEKPRLRIRGFYSQDFEAYPFPNRYALRGTSSPIIGELCGEMVGKSAVYYSEGNNVSLLLVMLSKPTMQSDSFTLYLTYRFLSRLSSRVSGGSLKHSPHLGFRVPGSFCDREFINCHHRKCVLRSPNFPGFYPRNITCRYGIAQKHVPDGYIAQIILLQPNEYKIAIYVGNSKIGRLPRTALTTNCFADVVDIYDDIRAKHLLGFCGAGSLPPVITSGRNAAVILRSTEHQLLHNSKVELQVKVQFINASEFRVRSGKCSFHIRSTNQKRGLLYTPHHSLPNNATCTYTLEGRTKAERVWLYFIKYYFRDERPYSKTETCLGGYLQIQGFESNLSNNTIKFCEKSHPKICARAGDFTDRIALRPCSFPQESYLSISSTVVITHHIGERRDISSLKDNFIASYEFVEGDIPVGCDRHFSSSADVKGNVSSPHNVFLYGRGGRRNLTCRYTFSASRNERVRIEIKSLRLTSDVCNHYYDVAFHRHKCRIKGFGQHSELKISEARNGLVLGCLCNMKDDTSGNIVIESLGPEVIMVFTLAEMSSLQDFNDCWFAAQYTFFDTTRCENGLSMTQDANQGSLTFTVSENPELYQYPLRCHWTLEASPTKYLYLKTRGSENSYGCPEKNTLLMFTHPNYQPLASVCASGNNDLSVFSGSWYNDTKGFHKLGYSDRVLIEIIGGAPGKFYVSWIEVTKLYVNKKIRNAECHYPCPELSACITSDLWCDGYQHCPSGYDESSEHCQTFLMVYIATGSGLALLALLIIFTLAVARCKRNRKKYSPRSGLQKDMYEMEAPVGTTINVY